MRPNRLTLKLVTLMAVAALMLAAPLAVSAAPPTPPTTTAPAAFGSPTTVTAYSGLRLREGAGLGYPVILTLRYGETVYPSTSVVWNQGIQWVFVRVYRWGYYYDGFCASNYLASYGGTDPGGTGGLKVTAAAGLRLRTGPGLGYGISRIVPYGTILQPTGATQWGSGLSWTQVSVNGITLWAATMYLTAV